MIRPVFVPLSIRRAVTDAIQAAERDYSDQTVASAQAEAAIDALQPFMERLRAGQPEYTIPAPGDQSDSLQHGST